MRNSVIPEWLRTVKMSDGSLMQQGATLFCDFDGPIADVSDRYYTTYTSALASTQADCAANGISLAIRRLTKSQFWRMKQNRVPDTAIADCSGLSATETRNFLGRVDELVNQPTLLHKDRLQTGAKTALAALNQRGIEVVIVTLRQASQVQNFLHEHGLLSMVQRIYGAQDTDCAYPNRVEHKVVQLRAAIAEQHRLGRSTETSWMIGDTEADICAGQAAGLPTIALTCGIRSADYLKGFNPTCLHRDLYSATKFLVTRQSSQSETPRFPVYAGSL
ncbi:MAG: HAD hydrolase-like protein [Cyanobacteria bacterium J06626_18]